MKAPIVIAAGGTGGHFFPAEALAHCLQQRGHTLILMTDSRNTHCKEGIFHNSPQYVLPGSGVTGKGLHEKLKGSFALLHGTFKARSLIRKIRPAAIVGFGGYPSIPPLLGARLISSTKRPPLVIHEGNAVLGKANALTARFATAIATSYGIVTRIPEHVSVHLTGMPVRAEIEALATTPYTPIIRDSEKPVYFLIWGGSLGASVFSHVVPKALAKLPVNFRHRLRVTQQIHQKDMARVQSYYAEAGIKASLCTFIHNVPELLQKAHLVIGRAGGSSVAELTMSGRPSILVPLPIAASDEQGANAQALEKKGAAWMIRQPDFNAGTLQKKLETLLDQPEQLTRAAHAAQALQHRHAAEKLADLVESVLEP